MDQLQYRPVFAAIDAGRPKTAVELLQKLSKATPKLLKSPTYQALLCLSYQRMGEEEEALEAYQALLKTNTEKEEKPATTSSTGKGKALAKGKGGRKALLKKVQKTQEPVEEEESKDEVAKVEDVQSDVKVFDDDVINIIQFALRGLGKFEELRKIYSDAWKAGYQIYEPEALSNQNSGQDQKETEKQETEEMEKNLEKGAQAFLCSVRLRDWHGMQESALLLLKQRKDPKMAHWASTAIYLQAIDPETPVDRKPLLLSLAHTLLTSTPANPYRTPEVFLLWVRICRSAGQVHRLLPEISMVHGVQNGSRLEKEALEALTPDLRKAEKGSEFEAGWWTAVGGDLRVKWERWETVSTVAERLIAGKGEKKQRSKDHADVLPDSEEDVPDADEQDEQGPPAEQSSIPSIVSDEVDWVHDWDWEKEWERGDDQIRGAEDLPETNYKAYLTHLSVLFLLLSQPELIKNPAKSSATYLTETRQTLLDLAASDRFSRKERAPLVALLAIETRLRDMNLRIDADTQSGTSREEVLQRYLDEYGHKGCVRDDLVACLNPSGAGDLSQISVSLEQMASAEHTDLKQYTRRLNAQKLLRYISPQNDAEQEQAVAKEYLKQYFEGVKYGKDLPVTEVKPADDFGIMAAQAYVSAWNVDRDAKASRPLLAAAIHVLERLLSDSPANGQARMLLIRLYRLIGAPSLVPEQVTPLKMRTFQQDTALHFVTERSSIDYVAGGEKTRTALAGLLLQSKDVYERTQSDVGENTVTAFMQESYSQIPSMLEFGDKFDHSHQRQLTELELVRHSAMRDFNELTGSDKKVIAQNLSLFSEDAAVDVRDWDLFTDFSSGRSSQTIVDITHASPLTTPASIGASTDAWRAILSADAKPLKASKELTSDQDSQLVGFTVALSSFVSKCQAGEAGDIAELLQILKNIAALKVDVTGWVIMEKAVTLMEAFALLEIAIAPYKVKTGKKGKGKSTSSTPAPVAQSVQAVLKESQDLVRSFATEFKASEASDPLIGQNYAVDLFKKMELVELFGANAIRRTEQALKESRQLATKEIFRELKRRSDG